MFPSVPSEMSFSSYFGFNWLNVQHLHDMVRELPISDLKFILRFANRNAIGKDMEVVARALDLLRLRHPAIEEKIRQLHQKRFQCRYRDVDPIVPSTETALIQESLTTALPITPAIRLTEVSAPSINSSASDRNESMCVRSRELEPDGKFVADKKLTFLAEPTMSFDDLPFYDIVSVLLKPTMLVELDSKDNHEQGFALELVSDQVYEISTSRAADVYNLQVQLRFHVYNENNDEYPKNLGVQVNNRCCKQLVKVPQNQKFTQPWQPLDITYLCDLSVKRAGEPSLNFLSVSWSSDLLQLKKYVVGVFLVRRLTPNILLTRLQSKGIRDSEVSRALVSQVHLSQDVSDVIATTVVESLLCPIGRKRIRVPCKSETCTHFRCFDAETYLEMNEKNGKWSCPICKRLLKFQDLVIDGYVAEILDIAPEDCRKIKLEMDGTWTCLKNQTEEL